MNDVLVADLKSTFSYGLFFRPVYASRAVQGGKNPFG